MSQLIPEIFLIEDHETLREMMVLSIELSDKLELSGAAGSGEEALEKLEQLETDLVLVDGSLPGMSGINFVKEIKKCRPDLLCLFFSGRDETEIVRQALEAGACGYVVKGGNQDEIATAAKLSMEGRCYISPSVAGWQGLVSAASGQHSDS